MRPFELIGWQPGWVTLPIEIVMGILALGILDLVLTRYVFSWYKSRVNNGEYILAREWNLFPEKWSLMFPVIPLLTHFLVGEKRYININLIPTAVKISLIGIIIACQYNVRGKETTSERVTRNATFTLNVTEEFMVPNTTSLVKRRNEAIKACFRKVDNEISYYSLRFNLDDNVQLANSYTTGASLEAYSINDSSVVCMSPSVVEEPDVLIKVKGCTRINPKNESCYTVQSENIYRKANISYVEDELYEGSFVNYRFRDYDPQQIQRTFTEYQNISFYCLTSTIGTDRDVYTHCLLVSVQSTKRQTQSLVERWGIEKDQTTGEDYFVLDYPGPIFDGDFNLGRYGSAKYLQLPFPYPDYQTLSSELVMYSSYYQYIGNDTNISTFWRLRYIPEVVTVIDVWAVGMIAATGGLILISFILSWCFVDRSLMYNTINGISEFHKRVCDVQTNKDYICLRFKSIDVRTDFGVIRRRVNRLEACAEGEDPCHAPFIDDEQDLRARLNQPERSS